MRHHFVRNVDLTAEIARCQVNMVVSDKLANMLILIVEKYALKPNWRQYSFLEDMKCEAVLQLVKCNETKSSNDFRPNILKFDLSYAQRTGKTPNPFAYATQIISNVFRRAVKLEGALTRFRDDCLLDAGHSPSAKRQFEDECNWSADPIPPPVKPRPPQRAKRGRPRSASSTHSDTLATD